ncbi:MAG TPA: hypothetical protein VJ837_04865 [Candidatus Paceibacterota bacterium]|nr:hypothetical protein [Candidatus Paceibacterota bacterium]
MKYLTWLKAISLISAAGLILGIATFNLASAQEAGECSVISESIVSDASTMVAGTSSVAVDNDAVTAGNQVPAAYTASIPDATWIWDDAQNDGAAATGTRTFTREFVWSSDATSTATLMIAADNSYSVSLNGTEVASSADDVNFTAETQDAYDISSALVDGTNTLEISVTNADNGADNPAGLLYKLSLSGFECEDEEEEQQPTGEIVEPDAGDAVSGTTTLLATYDDGDDINDDSVAWAVRSDGACSDPSKTVFGNVDGFSDSFGWDGASFSAVIDTMTVANGEYCFVFNPADDEGQDDVRLTSLFSVDNDAGDDDDGDGDDDDEDGDDDDDQGAKVTVCHMPPGNPSKAKTLSVSESALQAHLGHGDHEGACEETESASQSGNRGRGGR